MSRPCMCGGCRDCLSAQGVDPDFECMKCGGDRADCECWDCGGCEAVCDCAEAELATIRTVSAECAEVAA